MKILAFSDLHRDAGAAKAIAVASSGADVVIGAGDFTTFAKGAEDIFAVLTTIECPVIVIPGNHDDPGELQAICNDWTNGHFLHGDAVQIAGMTFFGLGGEIPRRNPADWNVWVGDGEAREHFANAPAHDVLVTHIPPLGFADLQRSGIHDGSAAVTEAIARHQPALNLCGHIHSAWGMSGLSGRTRIHNLGPTINWFDL